MPGPERPLLPHARRGRAGRLLCGKEMLCRRRFPPNSSLPVGQGAWELHQVRPRVQTPLGEGRAPVLYPVSALTAWRGPRHQPGSLRRAGSNTVLRG